jgi:hypothetical protein
MTLQLHGQFINILNCMWLVDNKKKVEIKSLKQAQSDNISGQKQK